jgi:hypothetical protein
MNNAQLAPYNLQLPKVEKSQSFDGITTRQVSVDMKSVDNIPTKTVY